MAAHPPPRRGRSSRWFADVCTIFLRLLWFEFRWLIRKLQWLLLGRLVHWERLKHIAGHRLQRVWLRTEWFDLWLRYLRFG